MFSLKPSAPAIVELLRSHGLRQTRDEPGAGTALRGDISGGIGERVRGQVHRMSREVFDAMRADEDFGVLLARDDAQTVFLRGRVREPAITFSSWLPSALMLPQVGRP